MRTSNLKLHQAIRATAYRNDLAFVSDRYPGLAFGVDALGLLVCTPYVWLKKYEDEGWPRDADGLEWEFVEIIPASLVTSPCFRVVGIDDHWSDLNPLSVVNMFGGIKVTAHGAPEKKRPVKAKKPAKNPKTKKATKKAASKVTK